MEPRGRAPPASITLTRASSHRFLALLRAISHVPMKPFRDAMEEMGFTSVESYGMSGNLMFDAATNDTSTLERQITQRFGTDAFIRTRAEIARVVAHDPLDAIVMFLERPPTATMRRAFLGLDLEGPRPVLTGRTLYFSYPVLLRGRRTALDVERTLGVKGTFRTSRVVATLLARMSHGPRTVTGRSVSA